MKDNVVEFPGKRFNPIDSVLFLLSNELTLQEAITSVMAQITAKHHLTEEELGDIWIMLYQGFLIDYYEK